jgi:hypothetical protein
MTRGESADPRSVRRFSPVGGSMRRDVGRGIRPRVSHNSSMASLLRPRLRFARVTAGIAVFALSWFVTACSSAADDRLVGVWELQRFDNLAPMDSPGPGEMPNILFKFFNDHELVYFLPGQPEKLVDTRGNLPFKGRIPYALSGNRFQGFLGLTNDLSGSAEVEFHGADEVDIRYPDGSIAVLGRLSAEPSRHDTPALRCVPQTIRGKGYDAAAVRTMRDELRGQGRNTDLESRLVGRWRGIPDDPAQDVVWLEFGKDGGLRTAASSPASTHRQPRGNEGTFVAKGSYLLTSRTCFAPWKVRLDGDVLQVANLRFERTDAALPTPAPPQSLEDAPHVIVQACLLDGSTPASLSLTTVTRYSESRGGIARSGTTTAGQAVYEEFTAKAGEGVRVELQVGDRDYWSVELRRLPELGASWTQWIEPHLHAVLQPGKDYLRGPNLPAEGSVHPPVKLRFREVPFKEYLDGVARRREKGPDTGIPGC